MLKAARAARGRVIAVVEPHRYTRVRDLFREFCACLRDADSVVVTPLYAAGETPIEGIDHHVLADGIRATGHAAVATVESARDLVPLIRRHARDMVVPRRRPLDGVGERAPRVAGRGRAASGASREVRPTVSFPI